MKHMNAVKGDKYKLGKYLSDDAYCLQLKLKGIRAFAYVTPGGTRFITRGGHDVSRHLSHLNVKYPDNIILDGELIINGEEDEVTSGILNRKSVSSESDMIQFIAFDLVSIEHYKDIHDFAYITRLNKLYDIFYSMSIHDIRPLNCIETIYKNKDAYYSDIMDDHTKEGVIFRNIHKPYVFGKRPVDHIIKYKKHDTYDVVVLGYTNGEGKYKDTIGSIEFGYYSPISKQFIPIGTCSGMTDDMRYSLDETLLFKVIEVMATEISPQGNLVEPRFKRFRFDKNPTECTKETIYGNN